MNYLKSKLGLLAREESGQSLIEYSLIASIVAVGAIVAMVAMRTQIVALFTAITHELRSTI